MLQLYLFTLHLGRRDAFLPIFAHMKTPPEIVYYDFACSMDEYFYNREPKFWEGTRAFCDMYCCCFRD